MSPQDSRYGLRKPGAIMVSDGGSARRCGENLCPLVEERVRFWISAKLDVLAVSHLRRCSCSTIESIGAVLDDPFDYEYRFAEQSTSTSTSTSTRKKTKSLALRLPAGMTCGSDTR